MKHSMSICYTRKPREDGVVRIRRISIREKILTRLLGHKQELTIIVPGNSVDTVEIREFKDDYETV